MSIMLKMDESYCKFVIITKFEIFSDFDRNKKCHGRNIITCS